MSLAPVPEIHELVAVAKSFVLGEKHFSEIVGPAQQCMWWCPVHNCHPEIQQLVADWYLMADRVWNEYGQHSNPMTVDEFRDQVARDLGLL